MLQPQVMLQCICCVIVEKKVKVYYSIIIQKSQKKVNSSLYVCEMLSLLKICCKAFYFIFYFFFASLFFGNSFSTRNSKAVWMHLNIQKRENLFDGQWHSNTFLWPLGRHSIFTYCWDVKSFRKVILLINRIISIGI